MATPRVVALRASGTNCHRETVHAFNLAGAQAEHVHINHLLKERDPLGKYQIIALCGGFTYGDDIAAGNYAAVTARFDPELQKRLSPKALQQVWDGYQRTFGAYQSHGGPEDTLRGDLTVVNVPLQMDRMPGQFRVKIHPDGTIAGVYFLREGVPVP